MPTSEFEICNERGRLLDELHQASLEYAAAVGDLVNKMGTLPEVEYKRFKAGVEGLRLEAEHRRDALRDHRINHGC